MDIFPKVNILLISPNMIVFTNVVAQAGYILDFYIDFFLWVVFRLRRMNQQLVIRLVF